MTIKIQSLKKGDTFYECEYGINVEYVALCDPYRAEDDKGWAIDGQMIGSSSPDDVIRDEPTWFYCSDAYSSYGPKLYNYPAYG